MDESKNLLLFSLYLNCFSLKNTCIARSHSIDFTLKVSGKVLKRKKIGNIDYIVLVVAGDRRAE